MLGIDFGTSQIRAARLSGEAVPEVIAALRFDSLKRMIGQSAEGLAEKNAELAFKTLRAVLEKTAEPFSPRIICSIPVIFNEARQNAVSQSAQEAGFEVTGWISDTQAGATAYQALSKLRGKIAVYHLGAGFFEFGIYEADGHKVQLLGVTGDDRFAGCDIDSEIVKSISQEIQAGQKLEKQIRTEAEKAKCSVSHRGSYDLRIQDAASGKRLDRAFSRYELEQITGPAIKKTFKAVEKTLSDAGLLPGTVDYIILIGGSTRMPLIWKMAEQLFQKKPISDLNPEHAVALGAALAAKKAA